MKCRWALTLLLCVLSVFIGACGTNLAGEPEIIATIPSSSNVPDVSLSTGGAQNVLASLPLNPDLARGAAVYEQNCTGCHGTSGAGDGAFVVSGDIDATTMVDFTQPSLSSPLERYNIVTNGKIENLMPPWANSLSDYERWAVTYYTLALPYTEAQIERGAEVAADITLADTVEMSDTALFDSFDSSLSDDDRWAGVAFARTQGYAVRPIDGVDAAPREVVTEGVVMGTVINGTAGSTVPADMSVTLHIMNGDTDETFEAPVNDSGGFSFANVPVHQERGYIVSAFYAGRFFGSELVQGGPVFGSVEMPVTLYEVTEEASVISIEGMAYQIQPDPDGNGLQVMQLVNVVNTSDQLFAASETLPDGARYASLAVPIPEGGELLQFAESVNRYAISADGGTVYDTRPVMPGEDHVMHMTYRIPYDGAFELSQQLGYAVNGFVEVYLPAGMSLGSDLIGNTGTQVQQAHRAFDIYAGDLILPASTTVGFRIAGLPVPSALDDQTVDSANVMVIVLGASGAVLVIVAIVWFVLVNRAGRVDLVEQIAVLDERFAAGTIDETTYQRRRDALKAKLAAQMQYNQPTS